MTDTFKPASDDEVARLLAEQSEESEFQAAYDAGAIIDVKQAGAILGVSSATVSKLIRDGRLAKVPAKRRSAMLVWLKDVEALRVAEQIANRPKMLGTIEFPRRSRGRQSVGKEAAYQGQVEAFCRLIRKIELTLDFKVGSRGWCYLLEPHGLTKGDFDEAQRLINNCRKSGALPLDICAEDTGRLAEHVEPEPDQGDVGIEADIVIKQLRFFRATAHDRWRPTSFWDYQPYYIEMLVEKIDLLSLFTGICSKYYFIPIQNNRGWGDINSKASMAKRFQKHEAAGRDCVLLYCGDHDPSGLNISNFLKENFEQLSGATNWSPDLLEVHRFGLNYDFIEENGLTWIENLETSSGEDLNDPKHKDFNKPYVQNYLAQFGPRKVEANALVVSPTAGRKLCEEAILKYIDQDGIDKYEKKLRDCRKRLKVEIDKRMAE